MKKNTLWEKGYGGLGMFIAGGMIAIVMYFYFYPNTFTKYPPTTTTQICYINPPDQSRSITSEGDTYALLKENAPVTSIQFFLHASAKTGKGIINGKEREIYKAVIGDDGTVQHGTWKLDADDRDAINLRFVDVTDESRPTPGISYINVYLKNGAPMPTFIQNFCGRKPVLPDIGIFPDDSEKSFPPYTIDIATIKDWHCESRADNAIARAQASAECAKRMNELPKDGTYYLYAYDNPGSYIYDAVNRTGVMPFGMIELSANGQTQEYQTMFAGGWESKHIAVYGPNPQDLSQQVAYRYIKKDHLNVGEKTNPYIKANEKNIDKDELQLDYFTPWIISHTGWWTPECKPAVYLYPKETMAVNVKVTINNGFLTYTDPLYPNTNGWNVIAQPDGSLRYINNNFSDSKGLVNYPTGMFPYLYYEGKVADSAVQKPEEGYVIAYDQLATFYDDLLPKLGLNQKESSEFKDYWLKALPKASYYFIGIIPQEQLNTNEPLTITPKEDTMIRVRLYFEARDEWQSVKAPELQRPARSGFTVVDWGGMVKADKEHPFTCLQ